MRCRPVAKPRGVYFNNFPPSLRRRYYPKATIAPHLASLENIALTWAV
jgi:hypothetical protein